VKPNHLSAAINGWCCWSPFSAREQEEQGGEPELVSLQPADSEVHRVRLAVPGAAVASERRVVPQVESGLVARCESLSARALAVGFEPLVVPRCELVAAAGCARLVVPGCRAGHSAPRRGLRPRLVQALVLLRRVAALREYAPQGWAARQAAFARGSVELARLAAVVSRAAEFVRPERLPGVARARDRRWAAGGPLPASADGRGLPRQIAHGSLRPGACVEPAQEPALCGARAALPARQA
jgi:hypothetical protein